MVELFAHRGLWSLDGPPENSSRAFSAAAKQGFGIELDVQLAKDNRPVVFHDSTLDRMTFESGPIRERTTEELFDILLRESDQRIFRLDDILMGHRRPTHILIELKAGSGDPDTYVEAVADCFPLSEGGPRLSLMSFDLDINEAIARLECPVSFERGVLLSHSREPSNHDFDQRLDAAIQLKPDFLGVWHSDASTVRSRVPDARILVWTVKSLSIAMEVSEYVEGIIFEHIDPRLVIR